MKFSKYLDADQKHNVFVGVGISLGGLLCAVSNAVGALYDGLGAAVGIFIHL